MSNYLPGLRWGKKYYSRQSCIDFILKFQKEYGRNPTQSDIKSCSSQKKSPSTGIFDRYGGIPYLIQQAGFVPNRHGSNSNLDYVDEGTARLKVLQWSKNLKDNDNPFSAFKRDRPINPLYVKKYYGTVKNCFLVLGITKARDSKLKKEPPLFK